MKAAIVAVGDELLCGQRLDTNSAWLSVQLGEVGIPVAVHATAPDDLETCAATLRFACENADIVLMTGGLGPTQDDLTREAIAAVCDTELELHEPSRDHIQRIFTDRQREMPASNLRQAMLPRGSAAIRNPHGTAPGIDVCVGLDKHSTRVFALPGVPAEMKDMWSDSVLPALCEMRARSPSVRGMPQIILHRTLKCFGIGESALEQKIEDFLRRGRQPSVGITTHRATITLRLTARGATAEACHALIERDMQAIRARLGDVVYGEGDEQPQDAVMRALSAREATLASCERYTCGLLARWLGAVNAASLYLGGISQPMGSLPPLQDLQACRAEAERVRAQFGADCTVVVGDLNQDEQALPLVAQWGATEAARMFPWTGHPDIREERTAKTALDMLRRLLTAHTPAP